jgi:hypothetical protein
MTTSADPFDVEADRYVSLNVLRQIVTADISVDLDDAATIMADAAANATTSDGSRHRRQSRPTMRRAPQCAN